ncbi:glycosyltransferase family 4 protein [Nitriliruptor alkaliphilus]|uniref:glycosyltransferase family 4 protein n=1 Tax=Nitriliruptor alkaliphilus TaxID=427918 RepID=UPI0006962ED6|nr:glycosyltransferase family 4 protein [Nitriliruptor alkaliphilus]
MRILQVAPPWFLVPPRAYGGIEEVVALLADGLVATGHQVTLLASGGSRTRARLWSTYNEPPSARLGDAATELSHVLQGHLHRRQFDVIHDHTASGAALGAMPGGPPVVHTLHGPWVPGTSDLCRSLGGRVHLVAISHDQANRAPADVQLAGVVHNGIDVAAHRYIGPRSGHLVFVGRANPVKGPDLAIEVARRLGRHLRMAIKVNEPAEHAYFDQVLAPMIAANDVELVTITEPRAKVELLGSACAVLFPIRWPEPFGLVPLEANACGTPVVAFADGAVPEVVCDGRSGVLVPPGDLDAFCSAVERAERMDATDCRAVAAERFDASVMVRSYEQVYARAVASNGTAAPPRQWPVPRAAAPRS